MDRLLDGLTEDQRRAVVMESSRLRILAGAGSGKTRVLTRRIAHQARATALDPTHTLALTFTRKSAGELRVRLRALGLRDDVAAGTFHAQAFAQLRARWADQGIRAPALLDRRGRVLHRVVPKSLSRVERLAVQNEVDWATARRIGPASYEAAAQRAGRRPAIAEARVAEYYRAFIDEKHKRRLVDFDDLLELAIRDLADPDYAAGRHWRYRHLFVDEFQDVNPLQFQLLRAWLGPEGTICAVGDPNQAIYSWNGADADYLERFDHHFPGADTVQLRQNFRSTPQILAAAAAVSGEAGRLVPTRPDGRLPEVRAFDTDLDEARGIARAVRDAHRPTARWGHQAVLVRTNAQTALIADALRQAEIPAAIRDGASLLDEPRVAQRLTALENDQKPLRTLVPDLAADASRDDEPGRDDLPAASAAALVRLAEDQIALHPEATIAEFVAWLRATVGGDSANPWDDAVEVVTFHAAKGLEWSVVHLAGLEDGLVPIAHATTPEAAAEERRLFYVAITRAENELHCSWARSRRFGERSMERRMSPLLARLSDRVHTERVDEDPAATANLDHVRSLRADLGVKAEVEADPLRTLREDIRQWRSNTARANQVPAYIVFDDRTLDALVEQRPASLEALNDVPGLGRVKIDRYGGDLLELLHPQMNTGGSAG